MLKMNTTNRYDKYKDSGIEWIGEIPDSWCVRKIKYFCIIYTGNSLRDDEKDNCIKKENSIPYISTKDIDLDTNVINYDNGLYVPIDSDNFKVAPKNSSLLCIEGGSAGRKIGYTDRDVCFVNKLCCFSVDSSINSKYLYYILQSDMFLTDFNLKMTGLIGGVSQNTIRNISVTNPNCKEQKQIAEYLDKKCGAIDETIEKQKSVIEKLKEYKQSIITQAVTKGLDKSAPMKDSGIEWIGQIPQHWKIKKGKRLLQLQNRPVIEGMEVVTCFRDGEVTLRKNRREDGFTFSDKEIGYQGIEIGDLVIHGMDGFAGAIGISDSCGKGSPVLNVCTAKNNDNLAYISFYLKVLASQNVFLALATGIRERSCDLRWNKIANLNFVIPTREEQKNIVEKKKKKCSEIDKTIEDKENLIEKLVEYKKSLIYECVTGKRRVI